jgi:hypothetical protein
MHHRPVMAAFLAVLLAGAAAPVTQAHANQARVLASRPGGSATLRAGETTQRPRPILAPAGVPNSAAGSESLVSSADIQVNYNGFSQAAHDSFEAAVTVWESMIVSSQVIHVDAYWTPLGSGVLGSAGPNNIYLINNAWYPGPLAEAICSCEADTGYEIEADFNSNFSAWYLGTDGNPPSSQYDFYTVVLHELGHGLGFLSSFEVSDTQGGWGWGSVYPLVFDTFEWSAPSGGTLLTDTSAYPNPSAALKTQLTDGSVYFGGSNVAATYGGMARLYAPTTWSPGSSNSHFDESSFPTGTPNALMTPALANGEVIHDPGPVMLALFRDIGWSTGGSAPPTEPGAPTGVMATPADASAYVSWSPPASDGGSPITGYTATSSPDAMSCTTSGTSCPVYGLTNGVPYTFTVTATNGVGTGAASSPSNTVTPGTPPDSTPPAVSPPTGALVAPQQLGTSALLRLTWPAASDPSGVASYQLERKKGTGAWVSVALSSPTATSADVAVVPNAKYSFRLRAADGLNNVSGWAATATAKLGLAQETSTAIAYGGRWKRPYLSGASGNYVRQTAVGGRFARLTFTGTSAALVSTLAPGRGIADIWLDGVYVGSVDLYRSSAMKKAVVWAPSASLIQGVHTLEVRVTGTRNAFATKNRVDVDAFLVWP